jgi:serine/threonine-protein kinase RsbW
VDLTSTDHIRLRVPASPAAVRIARAGATGLATRAGFTYQEVEQVRLAVGEATALLAPGPEEDGVLVLAFDVSPAGLWVDLQLVDAGAGPGHRDAADVPSIAAAVLDSTVDEWVVTDGGRRIVLDKRMSAPDADDDDD